MNVVKKINLLIFVKAIDGGTGTYILNLYQLRKKSFFKNIYIVVLEKPKFRIINHKEIIFFRKKGFYPEKFFFNFYNIKNFIEDFIFFSQIIKKYQPNLVLGVDLYCNLILSIYKVLFKNNVKIILTTHINIVNNLKKRSDFIIRGMIYKTINFFYNKADKLIFVSKQLLDYLKKKFQLDKNKCFFIYNGIYLNKFIKKIPNRDKQIIITIGRLVHQKDHLTLIKAFNQLLQKYKKAQLWILSDGYLKKQLIELVKNLKIEKNVKFFGWVKNINYFLKKSSIFVLSSKNEGFGYVIIEAMKYGLPVISSDVDFGPREILGNGKFGLLFKPGDYKDLKIKMLELLTNNKKYFYYVNRSLKRVKDFDIKIMLNKYERLFLSLFN